MDYDKRWNNFNANRIFFTSTRHSSHRESGVKDSWKGRTRIQSFMVNFGTLTNAVRAGIFSSRDAWNRIFEWSWLGRRVDEGERKCSLKRELGQALTLWFRDTSDLCPFLFTEWYFNSFTLGIYIYICNFKLKFQIKSKSCKEIIINSTNYEILNFVY